jgi:DNA modification methylase
MLELPPITSGQPLLDTIHHCDALTLLKALPDGCIDCVVTSPPYYGLRDYGVAGQIGLENTPAEYVATMVRLFREIRRVLKAEGTCWLNLGDSYNGSGKGLGHTEENTARKQLTNKGSLLDMQTDVAGLAPKNLLMIPARVAIALQDDGWILRSEIVWHKPNAMPESVKDRPTKAHEMVYLLTKSPEYFYDWEAVAEPTSPNSHGSPNVNPGQKAITLGNAHGKTSLGKWPPDGGELVRNKRTVWTVSTKPFAEAHFATFPPDLIEPMILAGCPVGGLVLDPFMGSGTTAIVARENLRYYIGSELNAKYVAMARRRLAVAYEVPLFVA